MREEVCFTLSNGTYTADMVKYIVPMKKLV